MHCFADDVLTQHWAQSSAPVSSTGVSGLSGSLELNVNEVTGGRSLFSQQDSTSVSQHREATELMTRVRLSNWASIFRNLLAAKQLRQRITVS